MHDTVFLGRIEVRPPLNAAERDYLGELAGSNGTLRGTPTGRGDDNVPFAHLAWEPCAAGCCLTWSGQERTPNMQLSLRFLVEHLLKTGARAAGHKRFEDFTCDHVLDGTVVGRRHDDERVYVAEVVANRVGGRSLESACEPSSQAPQPRGRPRTRPANVIEFRPRSAR